MRPFDLFVSLDALGWTPPHTLQSWLQGGCNGWKPSVQGGFARGVNAGMDVRQFLWLKKEGDQSDGWCLDCAQLTSSMNRCRRFIWRGWFYKLLQVALIKKDPWALGPKVPAAPDTFDFASRSWNCNAEMPGFWDKLIPQKNNQKRRQFCGIRRNAKKPLMKFHNIQKHPWVYITNIQKHKKKKLG